MKVKQTIGDNILDVFVYIFVTLFCISTLIPFWNVFVISITPSSVATMKFEFWPKTVDFSAWRAIISSEFMWQSFYNTVVRTVLGTAISLVLTVTTAYPLSKKKFIGRKAFLFMVTFTMIFSGGVIPTYLLVKNLNMINTIWALLIPSAIAPFYVIVMKSFFESIPDAIEESAFLDGANDIVILMKIALPLSLPSIATIALWTAVSQWNSWFDVVLYINDRSKYVLQMVLREMQTQEAAVMDINTSMGMVLPTAEAVRNASTLFVTIPILLVYPFLQKYFIKGVTIGAVKG